MPSGDERRINGLEYPYHPLQVATWLLFPVILLHYFLFIMPLMWRIHAVIVPITVVFIVASIVSAWAGYVTCAVDPADDSLTKDAAHCDSDVYCYLCEVNVHNTSKHCRFCDKCVKRFDHHCKWLNTCIGEKNYKYFLILVGGVGVMTTICLFFSIYFLVESFTSRGRFLDRISSSALLRSTLGMWSVIALLILSVAVLVLLVGLIYQLAGFHCMLVYKGITTYDFIVLESKRQREKKQQAAEKRDMKAKKKNESFGGGSELEIPANGASGSQISPGDGEDEEMAKSGNDDAGSDEELQGTQKAASSAAAQYSQVPSESPSRDECKQSNNAVVAREPSEDNAANI
mmetsp:Transcript_26654/g.39595  ORF Transcript_26654/g.39595 Transcript_26654/m.39595 type:complete len:345 (-) Transcript_26654:144-1178(-)|eukprot:CAMPEP_0185032172 /NCGR_PEP_ID=MMETSP1103-20130426/20079_1 /TAXON_ID=36769 /ORGANISM="Paraphysomonas bandaiensis, Strain Caron Lab Isolate" /LENGTH=344 /DNA_ID=CAMNT_0027567969 /DNA_START=108 /DNA_END=1142 /DNA_ORIENTATION=-